MSPGPSCRFARPVRRCGGSCAPAASRRARDGFRELRPRFLEPRASEIHGRFRTGDVLFAGAGRDHIETLPRGFGSGARHLLGPLCVIGFGTGDHTLADEALPPFAVRSRVSQHGFCFGERSDGFLSFLRPGTLPFAPQVRLARGELGLRRALTRAILTVVDDGQDLTGRDAVTLVHEHPIQAAADLREHANLFGDGLDEAGARHGLAFQ